MKIKECVCFDDVLLEPQVSDITSRDEIDLTTKLHGRFGFDYKLPIISSPMNTVTEAEMAIEMSRLGGLGIVHRYNSIDEQVTMVKEITKVASQNSESFGCAIGSVGDYLERAKELNKHGVDVFCIDVAHGHHSLTERALKTLRDYFGNQAVLIAGNIATAQAAYDLEKWGADALRVGVGGGSVCSTRVATGHGIPTLQSIIDCAEATKHATIIADGGIRNSGDAVKALAAGADWIMLGSVLAGTSESPGCFDAAGTKPYIGMASATAQQEWRKSEPGYVEGVASRVHAKGHIAGHLSRFAAGIRSGLSYSGARNLREFRTKAVFVKQSQAGLRESHPHHPGMR